MLITVSGGQPTVTEEPPPPDAVVDEAQRMLETLLREKYTLKSKVTGLERSLQVCVCVCFVWWWWEERCLCVCVKEMFVCVCVKEMFVYTNVLQCTVAYAHVPSMSIPPLPLNPTTTHRNVISDSTESSQHWKQ